MNRSLSVSVYFIINILFCPVLMPGGGLEEIHPRFRLNLADTMPVGQYMSLIELVQRNGWAYSRDLHQLVVCELFACMSPWYSLEQLQVHPEFIVETGPGVYLYGLCPWQLYQAGRPLTIAEVNGLWYH
ncbi:MAG: hypothetical protein GY799_12480 [Desulfobulbaceae bacterium]|nr:hypothetical protein [Desulfobulbaceae bacterium]